MKAAQFARKKIFQKLWLRLNKISLIGMNYWASNLENSGEIDAISFVKRKYTNKDRPIIFDVGANIGDFSIKCADIFQDNCNIFAFEPSKNTYKSYCDRLYKKIKSGIVFPINCGVGNQAGSVLLYSSEENSTIASVYQLDRPIRPFVDELTETITLVTIDEFCSEHGIDHIAFLKLDIEGHELAALSGASRMITEERIDAIQFEFGENNVSSRTFMSDFDKLLGEKFNIYRIIPGGLIKWTYQGGASEIFATMNYLAVKKAS